MASATPSKMTTRAMKRGAELNSPPAAPITHVKKTRFASYTPRNECDNHDGAMAAHGVKTKAVTRLRESPKLLATLATHGLSWVDVAPIFSECSASFLTELLDNPAKAGLIDVIVSAERKRCFGWETPGASEAHAGGSAPEVHADKSETLATDDELDTLRAFDLDPTFGPCVGLSRLSRWSRAARFGLGPPEGVKEILDSLDDEDPAQQSSVADHLS